MKCINEIANEVLEFGKFMLLDHVKLWLFSNSKSNHEEGVATLAHCVAKRMRHANSAQRTCICKLKCL